MESESDSGSSPDSRWRTIRSPKETLSTGGAALGRKAMEWFNRKTSIAGVQIPNWGIVLGAVIVISFIYSAFIH
jgi:hypothetical protein